MSVGGLSKSLALPVRAENADLGIYVVSGFPRTLNGRATRLTKTLNFRGLPGGAEGNRTPDLIIANDALYQLSYGPKEGAE